MSPTLLVRGIGAEARVRPVDENNGSGGSAATDVRRVPDSWRVLLDAVPAAVVIIAPDGTIRFTNTEFEHLTGYRRGELHGRVVEQLVPEQDRTAHETARGAYASRPERRPMGTDLDIMCRRADGSTFPADISLSPLEIGHEAFVIATVSDETEHRRSSDELFHRAVHDPLTGLPNRVLLEDRLTQALARADRQSRELAVLYVDLDGFKTVNDTWHHAVGDEVLRTVARRFAKAVRPQDTVARFGGDEFVVLCEELSDAEDAARVARRILESLGRPVHHREGRCRLGASIGVVLSDGQADAEALIERADRAMYRAKRRGGAAIELIDLRPEEPSGSTRREG
jgi:diguanylate cyclase (GGDEF)-like protein/PAS domain S-box-containing protein